LREKLITQKTICSLVQLEYSGFDGATVPICTFTLQNYTNCDYLGTYIRLADFKGAINQGPKTLEAIKNRNCGWLYNAKASNFKEIPESPIAYWAKKEYFDAFSLNESLGSCANIGKGLDTGDNNRFLRLWHEVNIQSNKWVICQKGGSFRKWYGNHDYVINWEGNGSVLKSFPGSNLRNAHNYFKQGITWTRVSSGDPAFRFFPEGQIFESTGPCLFLDNNKDQELMVLGYLNSELVNEFLKIIAPTLDFQSGHVSRLPFKSSSDEQIK
ncbi:TPA: SAM-dependent methyltransferase, partial [Enterobacter cloacae]|nr:SAM-dependent methyltransferase [Enterobacter cloacae]